MQVEFTHDKRAVKVTTKDTAPGGRRTEKVGLPYDPDLFDHMVSHGVVVEVTLCGLRILLCGEALRSCYLLSLQPDDGSPTGVPR